MPGERKGPASRGTYEGGKDMETVGRLEAPKRVQRLQSTLHAKAKEDPGFRFYSICDKIWRGDVLWDAWQEVRRNGGVCGVDGRTAGDVEAYGVERWLGELAKEPAVTMGHLPPPFQNPAERRFTGYITPGVGQQRHYLLHGGSSEYPGLLATSTIFFLSSSPSLFAGS